LIHDHAPGTFKPVIFEKLSHVGGIWPVRTDEQTNIVPPDMPTNASKHIVTFSDLAWDSIKVDNKKNPGEDIATFPKAHVVGKYLEAYADRYISSELVKFGREVVNISRTSENDTKWKVVSRAISNSQEPTSEDFDHVIVASGFFAAPDIPELPGLETFKGPIIHSSHLRDVENLLSSVKSRSKIVVIGGSMSGGEAAAALAFHISSLRQSAAKHNIETKDFCVYHVTPRPFWSVPPYCPLDPMVKGSLNPCPSFLPLDLIFGELSRRPGDQIRFAPSTTFAGEPAKFFNGALQSLVGGDQSRLGDGALVVPPSSFEKPPWLIISTTHAEFVRSGDIKVVIGRASGINQHNLRINRSIGDTLELDNVGMVVMATGFTPHPALSFLSPKVREELEYNVDDVYAPLKLHNLGTMHPSVPSLGFVGFYRGPYFGVLEQQSRFLGALWSDTLSKVPEELPASVADIEQRGQFPMGDYVGLMESFSAILGTDRAALSPEYSPRDGPAIPARYHGGTTTMNEFSTSQRRKACQSVIRTLGQPLLFLGPAVFRALQGRWKLTRQIKSALQTYPSGTFTGEANMYPRAPTADDYAAEFLYTEKGELVTQHGLRMTGSRSYVYRLSEFEPQTISAWFVKPESGSKEVDYMFHEIVFENKPSEKQDAEWGSGWRARGSHHLCVEDHYDTRYWFRFHAIEIPQWGIAYTVKGPNKDYWTKATYER
jgi:replicative DNA helicase